MQFHVENYSFRLNCLLPPSPEKFNQILSQQLHSPRSGSHYYYIAANFHQTQIFIGILCFKHACQIQKSYISSKHSKLWAGFQQ